MCLFWRKLDWIADLCVTAIRYIGDEEATKAVFDEHGYYKTNDLAEYRNGEYIFCGRENTDCESSSTIETDDLWGKSTLTLKRHSCLISELWILYYACGEQYFGSGLCC